MFALSEGLLVQVESSCDFEYYSCLKRIDCMYSLMMKYDDDDNDDDERERERESVCVCV